MPGVDNEGQRQQCKVYDELSEHKHVERSEAPITSSPTSDPDGNRHQCHEHKLNACLSHVPPGHASEMMSHEGEDFVYLAAGKMLYEVDGIAYELKAGDTLHFDSRKPHRGTNTGPDTAIELWVGTMRLFPE